MDHAGQLCCRWFMIQLLATSSDQALASAQRIDGREDASGLEIGETAGMAERALALEAGAARKAKALDPRTCVQRWGKAGVR